MISSGEPEGRIGLELFYTDTPGIGGSLRVEPEDFIVEEVSVMPEEDPTGENTAVIVRARYWETNRLVRKFARQLRISRKKIMFAGTKDKRAITTQLFVFAAPMDDVHSLNFKDVEFLNMYPTSKQIGLGDLIGNKFSITLKNLDMQVVEAMETTGQAAVLLEKIGGFPNLRRPRVIWVGMEKNVDFMTKIATHVELAMQDIGFEAETKRFRAHLTLGRVKDPRQINDLAAYLQDYKFDPIPIHFDRLVLFKSTLTRTGPIYDRLHEAVLGVKS